MGVSQSQYLSYSEIEFVTKSQNQLLRHSLTSTEAITVVREIMEARFPRRNSQRPAQAALTHIVVKYNAGVASKVNDLRKTSTEVNWPSDGNASLCPHWSAPPMALLESSAGSHHCRGHLPVAWSGHCLWTCKRGQGPQEVRGWLGGRKEVPGTCSSSQALPGPSVPRAACEIRQKQVEKTIIQIKKQQWL